MQLESLGCYRERTEANVPACIPRCTFVVSRMVETLEPYESTCVYYSSLKAYFPTTCVCATRRLRSPPPLSRPGSSLVTRRLRSPPPLSRPGSSLVTRRSSRARDLIVVVTNRRLADGTVMLIMASIVDPRFPEYPNKVRATLKVSGWKLVPSSDGSGTDVL